jgi:hypothetical protein
LQRAEASSSFEATLAELVSHLTTLSVKHGSSKEYISAIVPIFNVWPHFRHACSENCQALNAGLVAHARKRIFVSLFMSDGILPACSSVRHRVSVLTRTVFLSKAEPSAKLDRATLLTFILPLLDDEQVRWCGNSGDAHSAARRP